MAFKRLTYPFIAFFFLGAFACKGAILRNPSVYLGSATEQSYRGFSPFFLKPEDWVRISSNQREIEFVCLSFQF